jgi:hypothetical protein
MPRAQAPGPPAGPGSWCHGLGVTGPARAQGRPGPGRLPPCTAGRALAPGRPAGGDGATTVTPGPAAASPDRGMPGVVPGPLSGRMNDSDRRLRRTRTRAGTRTRSDRRPGPIMIIGPTSEDSDSVRAVALACHDHPITGMA